MRVRPDWDTYFMRIAKVVAQRSHDEDTQVGCVIVSPDKRILSTGYNGFPPGFPDGKLPRTRPGKYPYIVHSEINAIVSALNRDLRGATLYCRFTPCKDCVKAIITAGITRIVYEETYARDNTDAAVVFEMLEMGGVEIVKHLEHEHEADSD